MKQNNWFDPFFILENLSHEEKLIQKNVKDLFRIIKKNPKWKGKISIH